MMTALNSGQSGLDLFFNPALGGNSPQLSPTPVFLEVVIATSRLLDALSLASSQSFALASQAREQLQKGVLIDTKLKAELSYTRLNELIHWLEDLNRWARKNAKADPSIDLILAAARKLLVSLLLFARDTEDENTKSLVLQLAKGWDQ
jgi:hypothetical protein